MYPGRFYHVFNRGNHKQQVFTSAEDYHSFLEKWKKYIVPVADTWAYTLLSNHFHVVVRLHENTETDVIRKAFSNFFNSFSRVLQNRHGYSGALFQRPFQRKEILTDEQLRWTLGYVLTNITHHNPEKDYREYKWSSYQATLSNQPTLLPRQRIYHLFDGLDGLLEFLQNQAGYYGWEEEP